MVNKKILTIIFDVTSEASLFDHYHTLKILEKYRHILYLEPKLSILCLKIYFYTLEVLKWDKNISKKTKRLPVSGHLRATHFGATT